MPYPRQPRDANGWRVPHPGTKSYLVYHLMVAGWRAAEIVELMGDKAILIRVLMHKIRHPEINNERSTQWAANNPAKVSIGSTRRYRRDSRYVHKLVRHLGVSVTIAREMEKATQ